MELKIPTIPGPIQWKNHPKYWQIQPGGCLVIEAGPKTDWFTDPAGHPPSDNAPAALFAPGDENFMISDRVAVDFTTTFDAGVLQVREADSIWAKLCLEYSPQKQPMIVSVVTRGVSDDCNSQPIDDRQVYLRIMRKLDIFAFHFSRDGRFWHLVRYFTLGPLSDMHIGFSSQSPNG